MDRGHTVICFSDSLVSVRLGSMLARREQYQRNFPVALREEGGHHPYGDKIGSADGPDLYYSPYGRQLMQYNIGQRPFGPSTSVHRPFG
ncbi:hypothetical protein GOBAR_DD20527 [Gossypium barbadense]|nr:hypothetical protein GOBAR_DD20527 [Gossypium barbadense]